MVKKILNLQKYWQKKAAEVGLSVKQLQDFCNESMLIWAETHRIINGNDFTLIEYPFLEDIYNDNHQDISVIKSAQAGLSEYYVTLMFWLTDTKKKKPYFVFPKRTDVNTFVQGRVDLALDETPYLASKIVKTDNTSLKLFNKTQMYFTGAQRRTQIISSPADCVMLDEYDEHNWGVTETVMKRLNNSMMKWVRRISTPKRPDTGIHKAYMEGDQRVYCLTCDRCGKTSPWTGMDIDWEKHINQRGSKEDPEYYFCCPKCRKDIDHTKHGTWIILNPGAKNHSYSINRMITRTCEAKELIKNSQMDNIAEFFNSDLGLPYESKGSRVYDRDLDMCRMEYNFISKGLPGQEYYLGLDIGKKHNYVILSPKGDRYRIVSMGKLNSWEEIEALFQSFDFKFAIVDLYPESTKATELCNKHLQLRGAQSVEMAVPTHPDGKEEHIISLNRFHSIDRVYQYILQQRIEIPFDIGGQAARAEFYSHMTSQMKIETVSEKTGNMRVDFKPIKGKKMADHYLMATIYALAAIDCEMAFRGRQCESGFIIV